LVCPMLAICKAKVNYETFSKMCASVDTDSYKKCEEYKKQSATLQTPLDWSKMVTPSST
jgi:hypothetical protein